MVALQEEVVVRSACSVPRVCACPLFMSCVASVSPAFSFPSPLPCPCLPCPCLLCPCAAREHSPWPQGRLVHTWYGNDVLSGRQVAWCVHGARTFSSRAAESPACIGCMHGAGMSSVWPPGTLVRAPRENVLLPFLRGPWCVRRGRTSSSLAAGSPVCAPRWNVLLQLLNSFLYLLLPVCGVCLSVCATVPDTEVTHRRSQLSEHSAQWRSRPHRAVRSSPCFALGHSLPSETVACLPASRSVGSHSPASRLCASARCARRVHTVSRLGSPREAPLQNVLPWWHASARPSSL